MKKALLMAAILVSVLVLTVGIVDGLSRLTSDIINHSWLNLVGRWQSDENSYFVIEFNPDGTFAEYYYGVRKASGDFKMDGNGIELFYDGTSCRNRAGSGCTVRMEFTFIGDTLILAGEENEKQYHKASDK
jgi:hypothetical protein